MNEKFESEKLPEQFVFDVVGTEVSSLEKVLDDLFVEVGTSAHPLEIELSQPFLNQNSRKECTFICFRGLEEGKKELQISDERSLV